MAFYKTAGFKYAKNLAIGVGAAVVLLGALFKIESWEGGSEMLIIGMSVEACIFLMLGLIPPEKDYY
jgi:gliding motility-associated protein GldL